MRLPLTRHLGMVILPALAFASPALAQTGVLAGTVRNAETEEPVAGAAVRILGAEEAEAGAVLTSPEGTFRLSLAPGRYSIVISLIGYNTKRVDGIRVTEGDTTTHNVNLVTRALALNPVVVTASRKRQKKLDAPASIAIVGREKIRERAALTVTEHLRSLPGVDMAQTGITSTAVVTRGFSNVFSGALLVIVDNRYASVPSLRLNSYALIPNTNMDLERVEVLLGPGAALYGPNSANGVMHLITSSPLDDPGASVALTSGLRSGNDVDAASGSVFAGAFRHASRLSDKLGLKVSGQWSASDDWHAIDSVEVLARRANPTNRLIANRTPESERWGGEVRLDYRPWDDGAVILNGGLTQMVSDIQLTGVGAAQAKDWRYSYLQSRVTKGRLFAQAFLNISGAGDTYLLRTGSPIVDESRMFVAQLQHGFSVGDRQDLTYGLDLQFTRPRTGGTITGENEDDDNVNEIGGYLHAETKLADRVDLVTALRIDRHNRLEGVILSPRAALVFKPEEGQNLRLTFNRAFATPSTNNLFLDLVAASIPLFGPVKYDIRTSGVPQGGFTFNERCPGGYMNLCMYSPFLTGAQLPATAVPFWNSIVGGLAAANPTFALVAPLLMNPGPGDPALASILRRFNTSAQSTGEGEVFPVDRMGPSAISSLEPTIYNTLETGYKGLIAGRFLLSADVYWRSIKNFVGPLRVETPNVFLDPAATQAFVLHRLGTLVGTVLTAEQAQTIIETLAAIPIGTVAPDQRSNSDLLLTYRNFGDLDLWGADLGAELIASDRLSFQAAFSLISDDCLDFNEDGSCLSTVDIALNAPRTKGSLTAKYRNQVRGLTLEGRARFTDTFPMNSGVYLGQVDGYTLFDANLQYRLSRVPGASITLTGTNIFDSLHTEFIGASQIGRLLLAQVTYEF